MARPPGAPREEYHLNEEEWASIRTKQASRAVNAHLYACGACRRTSDVYTMVKNKLRSCRERRPQIDFTKLIVVDLEDLEYPVKVGFCPERKTWVWSCERLNSVGFPVQTFEEGKNRVIMGFFVALVEPDILVRRLPNMLIHDLNTKWLVTYAYRLEEAWAERCDIFGLSR